MNLLDYLDPVELDKPDDYFLQSDEVLSKKITIFTPNAEIGELSNYHIVLLGVPEDRNSYNKGASLAPDKIRGELYKLISTFEKTQILDLGNVKAGNTFTDTYYAVKEVINYLLAQNVIIVLVGGTQEITLPVFQSFEAIKNKINLTVFDARIDSQKDALKANSDSYLFDLLLKKQKLFRFVHVGHQTYLTEKHSLNLINKLFHEAIRLGEMRNDLRQAEPFIRDSDIVSIDMGCIRQSDAPGHFRATPNGFYAEEACLFSRYAGLGDNVRTFGIFETNPKFDSNNLTAALAAQMIWHFIDGVENRRIEIPHEEDSNFKTFIVGHTDLDYDMIFFKSMVTERWWLQIPNTATDKPVTISCSLDDYNSACNHEVPDIWWKNFQKLD